MMCLFITMMDNSTYNYHIWHMITTWWWLLLLSLLWWLNKHTHEDHVWFCTYGCLCTHVVCLCICAFVWCTCALVSLHVIVCICTYDYIHCVITYIHITQKCIYDYVHTYGMHFCVMKCAYGIHFRVLIMCIRMSMYIRSMIMYICIRNMQQMSIFSYYVDS